jgi:hypothetical protein
MKRTFISIGLAIALCASACLVIAAPPSGAATAVQPPSVAAATAALGQVQTAATTANQPPAATTTAATPATMNAGADAAATAADGTPASGGWPTSAATPVNTPDEPTSAQEQTYQGTAMDGTPANTPTVTPTAAGVTAVSPVGTIGVDLAKPAAAVQVGGADVLASTDPITNTATTTVAQAPTGTGDLTMAQVISNPAQTVSSYKFTLPTGYKLVPQTDGSIAIMSGPETKAPTQATTLGWIDSPWAIDANGVSVPTSYTVSGKVLTQTIQPNASTVFPVVADPSISFGWFIYINFSHSDLLWAKFVGAIEDATNYASIACAILGAAPAAGWAAAFICGIMMQTVGIWFNGLTNNALGQITQIGDPFCLGDGVLMPPTCPTGSWGKPFIVGKGTIFQNWQVDVYWTGLQFLVTYVVYAFAGWNYTINP